MPLTAYMQKQCLDFLLGGAGAISGPAGQWMNVATASPTGANAYDAPVTSRQTLNCGAGAASPAGTASNRSSMTNTVTAACTVVGWNLYDAAAAGNRLAYGTLAGTMGCASGSPAVFSRGAWKITIT